MMDCNKFEEMISALADGELSREEKRELDVHLSACARCVALKEKIELLKGAVSSLPLEEPDAEKAERIRRSSKARKINYLPQAAAILLVVGLSGVLALRAVQGDKKVNIKLASPNTSYQLMRQSPGGVNGNAEKIFPSDSGKKTANYDVAKSGACAERNYAAGQIGRKFAVPSYKLSPGPPHAKIRGAKPKIDYSQIRDIEIERTFAYPGGGRGKRIIYRMDKDKEKIKEFANAYNKAARYGRGESYCEQCNSFKLVVKFSDGSMIAVYGSKRTGSDDFQTLVKDGRQMDIKGEELQGFFDELR